MNEWDDDKPVGGCVGITIAIGLMGAIPLGLAIAWLIWKIIQRVF